MVRRAPLATVLALALGLGLAAGCTRPNDSYCCSDPLLCADVGGVTSDCRFGTICDDRGALEGTPHTCVNDPAAVTCDGPSDCDAPTPACVGDVCVPCASDDDCPDPTEARCDLDTNRCVPCDDGDQCSQFGSDTCNAGICVECAPEGAPAESGECAIDEPICAAPGICRACTDHRECSSGACDLAAGACVLPADIAYVDDDASGGDTECTSALPCQEIADGIATGRPYVVIAAGSYQEDLAVADRDITLVGHGATLTAQTNGVVALEVSGTTGAVTIHGLTIDGSAKGIDCTGGNDAATTSIVLEGVTISDSVQYGILAYRCDLILRGSRVTSNAGGGIEVSRGGFDITSSVIDGNGPLGIFGGLQLTTPRPVPARLAFNTIVDNEIDSGSNAPGVTCASAAGLPAFHSNIITGNLGGTSGAQVSGQPNCSYEYSLIDPAVEGTANIVGTPGFVDADYHIGERSPARDMGRPSSDVSEDMDGQPRPADAPDIGADEYVAP